jgi:hypothetical protein
MASKITIKRSTAALPPAGLSFGELAFVQGTGLTANQLYVGLTGASPVWVGAQISTTGSWTDNAARTSLATQYAIDQRISSQISATNLITTADDTSNATRYLVFTTGAGSGVTLGVDVAAGALSYNPLTSRLTLAGDIEVNGGDITTNQPLATVFNTNATSLLIGSAATGITMGAATGNFGIRNPSLTVGSSGITGTIYADDASLILTTKNWDGMSADPADSPAKIIINPEISAGFVNIEGSDLRLGNKTKATTVSGVNIVFEGTTNNANRLTLTAADPASSFTVTLPHATDTLVGKLTTDTFTNKTFDTAGTGNVFRIAGVTLSGVTGTGSVVLSTSPTLVTPALGTPSALVGTNITGTATGLTAGRVVTNANLTGAITSVGNGTTLGSFSSAQLLTALTDETGSGSAVFGTAPSLSLPRYSISATVSAAGTVQGTATALTSDINVITTATLGSATGVVLPTAVAGVRVLVRNAHATVGINVYPASGASIDNASTNVAKAMSVLQTLEFVAISSTEWQSNVRVTDSQVLRNNDFITDASTFNFSGTTLSAKRSYILPDADGTIALVGNKLSTFAATTSAELAGIISDETGSASSGKLVFNTSPTITTSLLTASTTFALLNDTATTINFAGGASTALNIGNASGNATFAGNVIVNGDFTVQGNTTTLNTTTLNVEDFNITMGLTLTNANQCTGAGIGIGVGTGITFAYNHPTTSWLSSVDLDLATAKVYKIGGTPVLSSSALGSGVTGSSLTQVGTITSGTWSGSFGAVSGANLTVLTAGGLTGTIPSGVLGNSSLHIGTTSIALNRGSLGLTLAGVSIDGTAGTATNIVATEQITGTMYLVGVAAAGTQGLRVNASPAGALEYNVATGELSAALIDGGSF